MMSFISPTKHAAMISFGYKWRPKRLRFAPIRIEEQQPPPPCVVSQLYWFST